MSSASNIKNKKVRDEVIFSLKQLNERLKEIKTIPPNGLVMCGGKINDCF